MPKQNSSQAGFMLPISGHQYSQLGDDDDGCSCCCGGSSKKSKKQQQQQPMNVNLIVDPAFFTNASRSMPASYSQAKALETARRASEKSKRSKKAKKRRRYQHDKADQVDPSSSDDDDNKSDSSDSSAASSFNIPDEPAQDADPFSLQQSAMTAMTQQRQRLIARSRLRKIAAFDFLWFVLWSVEVVWAIGFTPSCPPGTGSGWCVCWTCT